MGVDISDAANTLILTPLFALCALGVCGIGVCGGAEVMGGSGARLGTAFIGSVFVYGPELLLFICIDFRTNPAIRFRVGDRPSFGVGGLLDEGVCGCFRRKSVRTAEAESKMGTETPARLASLRRREPSRQKQATDMRIPATMPGKKPAKTAPAGNAGQLATGVVTVEAVAAAAGTVVWVVVAALVEVVGFTEPAVEAGAVDAADFEEEEAAAV